MLNIIYLIPIEMYQRDGLLTSAATESVIDAAGGLEPSLACLASRLKRLSSLHERSRLRQCNGVVVAASHRRKQFEQSRRRAQGTKLSFRLLRGWSK